MSGPTKARSSPSAARCVGRALRGRTTCASTDVVNACGGEGDGVSTILPQRSLLHDRRNTLQSFEGDHVFKMVIVSKAIVTSPQITFGTSLLLRNSIRASSLTPPEWDNAMFG
ncbi:hypothetical protein evm_008427 [Chilo suppressalis]|nr:hypothetical protein evm_008427 [Chilo suppressalis]